MTHYKDNYFSLTNKISPAQGDEMVLEDLTIRHTQLYDREKPSGLKAADFTKHLHKFIVSAGVEPVLLEHVGTNDTGTFRREILSA